MPGTRCTVSFCKNSLSQTKQNPSTVHIKYHKFPKEPEIRKQWVQYCRRNGTWNPDSCHVCSEHFKPEDYERDLQAELLNLKPRNHLRVSSVPSMPPQLGSQEREPIKKRRLKRYSKNQLTLIKPIPVVSKDIKHGSSKTKPNERDSLTTNRSKKCKNDHVQADVPQENVTVFGTNHCIMSENPEEKKLNELRIENARLNEECKHLQVSLQLEIQERSILLLKLKRAHEDIEFKNKILHSQKKRLQILKLKKLGQ